MKTSLGVMVICVLVSVPLELSGHHEWSMYVLGISAGFSLNTLLINFTGDSK